jgi:NAD(P)H-dependent FMN reductase
MLRLPVILGTIREGRRSEHVARYVHGRLLERPGVQSDFVDPRDYAFGDLVQREFEMRERPEKVVRFVELVERADGFVIVTPEYNYSMPGALKNLLDITFKPWNRKPFGLVGCGGISGGLRALDMVRQTVAGLGAITVPQHVPVPHVSKVFGKEGPLMEPEEWGKRIDGFLEHVEWYAKALKAARGGPD